MVSLSIARQKLQDYSPAAPMVPTAAEKVPENERAHFRGLSHCDGFCLFAFFVCLKFFGGRRGPFYKKAPYIISPLNQNLKDYLRKSKNPPEGGFSINYLIKLNKALHLRGCGLRP